MSRLAVFARVAVSSALVACITTQPAWGWGAVGHSLINRLAIQYLPSSVPAFLRSANAVAVIEYLGPEPDRWRNRAEDELSQTQAPDHFIDLEYAELAGTPCPPGAAADSGCIDGKMLPRTRYDFIRALTAAQAAHPDIQLTPEKVGLQPWQVEEVWERLKVDFRDYRALEGAHQNTAGVETAILYDCGWLGHYVADGSQPLHTTIEYNGWTGPNPKHYDTGHGIHSLFETVYVTANVKPSEVAPLVGDTQPKVINDEWTQYLDYLGNTHSLVDEVYQIDKDGGFNGAGTPQAKNFTEQRLAAGAIELRNLIYSAWVHSDDPVQQFRGPQ
jgi:hypothetical protein